MNELEPAPPKRRPLIVRQGKKLRRHVDGWVARSSLVPNDPVLDPAHFPFLQGLRDYWTQIRDEALAATSNLDAVPALRRISPDHARIAANDDWRSFFLIAYGIRAEQNIARCPVTMSVLERIPGLNSGFFSILKPGTHIPRHRGVTKGLLTCHLGLVVPSGGSVRMQVGDQTVGWGEGETLVFDDTYQHEVWNDTNGTRIVLLVQFERPLRLPGRLIARAFLGAVRHSPFVREGRRNLDRWEESMKKIEAEANE
jgi:beta-hydroxylase